jgi:5-methylcytosine-specific restriction endonuclease McrBC regulatory subunit McrC
MEKKEFVLRIGAFIQLQTLAMESEISVEELQLILKKQIKEHFKLFGCIPFSIEYSRFHDDEILTAGSIIGRINCHFFILVIEPKFINLDIGKCLQMAHRCRSNDLVNHKSEISSDFISDLDHLSSIDYFSQVFINTVQDCINNGLTTVFSESTAQQKDLKGKLAVNDHISHGGNPLNPSVTKTYRSQNNIANSVLKFALEICKRKCRNDNVRMLSDNLLLEFKDCSIPSDIEDIDFSDLTTTIPRPDYDRALSIASVLIKGFDPTSGTTSGFSPFFTIDLDKLFEYFCTYEIKKLLSDNFFDVSSQDIAAHPFSPPLAAKQIKPDIVVKPKLDNHRTILADAKNKFSLSSNDISLLSNSDIFQIFYYAYTYKTNIGILLYPGDSKSCTKYPIKGSVSEKAHKEKREKIISDMKKSGKDIFYFGDEETFYLITWRINLSGTLRDTRQSIAELCQFISDASSKTILL